MLERDHDAVDVPRELRNNPSSSHRKPAQASLLTSRAGFPRLAGDEGDDLGHPT